MRPLGGSVLPESRAAAKDDTPNPANQLAEMLLSAMGSSLTPEHQPPRKVNPVSRRLASVEAASEQLGFRATVSVEEGLRSLVAWWQRERSLVQP